MVLIDPVGLDAEGAAIGAIIGDVVGNMCVDDNDDECNGRPAPKIRQIGPPGWVLCDYVCKKTPSQKFT